MIANSSHYFQHFLDFPGRIGVVKDSGTSYQDLSAGLQNLLHGFGVDTAINLNHTTVPPAMDELFRLADLLYGVRDELLPSKSRIDAHYQQHIRQTQGVFDQSHGRGGIDRDSYANVV